MGFITIPLKEVPKNEMATLFSFIHKFSVTRSAFGTSTQYIYFNPMEEPPGAESYLTEDLQRPSWISATGCHRAVVNLTISKGKFPRCKM